MEQTRALNALEPFLALTKSASSPRAAADLISRATSHPNTFIFAELLQAPQIQALANAPPEQASYLSLLKIFSYGTYNDYTNTSNLPPLNPQQILKLRQLSFLTLARDPINLSYGNLLRKLGLETQRELEDLVISAIYAGLVSGTLDPYHRVVCLSSVSPLRDLPPASIPSMLRTLDAWSSRCVSTLAELEKQIESVKAEALKRKESINREREELDKATSLEKQGEGKTLDKSGQGDLFAHLTRKLGAGAASKRGNGGLDREDSDDMDLDDDDDDFVEPKESRAAKKRTFFGKS
ncbi:hypothetical protein OIDMADRAFT_129072 [Oidiodendron maius Zn]|uniref:PCI domain-containing protein n=1 Tax=Oidiodendron maius (strain Zn) TaxID=913774 RepID=A0A0C3D7Z0_OIDMZ|nr:hypothetical protein OIDMADRAFT_129072 [Oidiodendron maius Zn]